jgi:hypothetical protein
MDGVHALILKSERRPATYLPTQSGKVRVSRYFFLKGKERQNTIHQPQHITISSIIVICYYKFHHHHAPCARMCLVSASSYTINLSCFV